MANKRELQALIVLAGKVDPSLQKAMQKASGDTQKTSAAFSKLASRTNKMVDDVIKSAVRLGGAVGVSLGIVAAKGLDLASDLTEVQNVVDVSFGQNAKKIDQWAITALDAFGLAELQAKQYSGTMGAMLKSSKLAGDAVLMMSENLTGLAGDFASFYNLTSDEAFEKIRSGISGETEPLKQLGINMSVANLEAFALSKGIKTSYQKMDQASQVALRYAYLMDVSKDAQGDFARTQGQHANQSRLLRVNLEQLAAKAMSVLLPAWTELEKKANTFIRSITDSPEKMQQIQAAVMGLGDEIGKALDVGVRLYQYISQNWDNIVPLIWTIVAAITAWKLGNLILDVVTLGKELYTLAGAIKASTISIWGSVSAKIADKAETLAIMALYAGDFVRSVGQSVVAIGSQTAATLANTIQLGAQKVGMLAFKAVQLVSTGVTWGLTAAQWALNAAFFASPIGWIVLGIGALIAIGVLLWKNWDIITAKAQSLWESTKVIFGGIGSAIGAAFKFGVNIAIRAINKIIQTVNKLNFKVPDWVPVVGGTQVGFQLPELPLFAYGGFATQPSIFGEAGPEAAIPIKYKNPRSLSLLNQTAKAIGADQGGYSGAPSFVYAPTIYGTNTAEIKQLLDDGMEQFKAKMEAWWLEKERTSFG